MLLLLYNRAIQNKTNRIRIGMAADSTMSKLPESMVLHSFTRTGEPPLQAVVDRFVKPVSIGSLKDDQSISEYVWNTCDTIIAVAAGTAHSHQAGLVQFILKLQQQMPKVAETGEVLEHENGVIWRDLPVFGWAARQAWNFCKLVLYRPRGVLLRTQFG